jgi:hypothetical protein
MLPTVAARAQSPFISIVSGNSGDVSGTAHNLKIDTSGTISYTNGLTGSFSTSYNTTNHVIGTLSTPTNTGYTTKPVVTTDANLIAYTGQVAITDPNGSTLQSLLISSYNPETNTNSDAVGYYKYDFTFTISTASGKPYEIAGFADSDNEIQDVILDYSSNGTTQSGTVLAVSAINGSEIRTKNDAKSNAHFSSTPSTTLAGTHTISIIYYNASGPSDMSFGVTAQAVPEPTSVVIALTGFPGLLAAAAGRRRRRV